VIEHAGHLLQVLQGWISPDDDDQTEAAE
jgi:hypothetical protein